MLPKSPFHLDEVWEEVNHKASSEIIESFDLFSAGVCKFLFNGWIILSQPVLSRHFPQVIVKLKLNMLCREIQLQQDFTVGGATLVQHNRKKKKNFLSLVTTG